MTIEKKCSHSAIKHVRFLTDMNTLVIGEHTVYLRYKLAGVLKLLIKNKNNITLREELLQEIWDGNSFTCKAGITHAICKLRKTLSVHVGEGIRITTLSKIGYRLIVDPKIAHIGLSKLDETKTNSTSFTTHLDESHAYLHHDFLSKTNVLIN